MVQSTLMKPLSDARYEARLARYAPYLPFPSKEHRDILAELHTTGVAVRTIDMPAEVLACADRLVALLRHKETKAPCLLATPEELGDDPSLFIWGLSDGLLDLAEGYIGLPVRYLGVEVKLESINTDESGRCTAIRSWHLDHEDRRIFKVIVYLSDVHRGSAPFGYVERSHTGNIRTLISRQEDWLDDERVSTVVPREDWKHVTGPRLTAVHTDTGKVFHRVHPPVTHERYSVTFGYCSRHPFYTYPRLMLPRKMLRQIRSQLTQRQRDAVPVMRHP